MSDRELVSVRYMVEDVPESIAFYTGVMGFTLQMDASPAFASVLRGNLRLLLSGKTSSGARPMPDGRQPVPGGWNRFQIHVADIEAEVQRLRAARVKFRNEIIRGVGGAQVMVEDPSGNPIEIFEPSQGR